MYLAGVLSGLLGIGSGVLKVPAMDLAMHIPMKVSTATSNLSDRFHGGSERGRLLSPR